MTDQEIIEVVTAHSEGKQIECMDKEKDGDGWSRAFPTWNFSRFDFRVKPEPPKPREFWITLGGQVWSKKELALDWFKYHEDVEKYVIHVREVLE